MGTAVRRRVKPIRIERTPPGPTSAQRQRELAGIPPRPTPAEIAKVGAYIDFMLNTNMPLVASAVDKVLHLQGDPAGAQKKVMVAIMWTALAYVLNTAGDDIENAVTQTLQG